MSHEIWNEKFLAVRTPAWHKVGHLFTDPVSPTEATSFLDFKEPELVQLQLPNGEPLQYYAVKLENEIFGVVSDKWEMIPLEPLLPHLDDFARQFPLSAAGQLRGGRLVFFTFEHRGEILGEEYIKHLIVLHSYEPGRTWKLLYSPTRVVCMNTVIAAESDAVWELKIRHQRSDVEMIPQAILSAQAQVLQSTVDQKLAAFAKINDFDAQLDALFEYVYQMPKAPTQREKIKFGEERAKEMYDRQVEQVLALRNLTRTAYNRFNDEYPTLANTGYAALQAVTEIADWRPNQKSKESPLLGTRALEKTKAWGYLSSQLA